MNNYNVRQKTCDIIKGLRMSQDREERDLFLLEGTRKRNVIRSKAKEGTEIGTQ